MAFYAIYYHTRTTVVANHIATHVCGKFSQQLRCFELCTVKTPQKSKFYAHGQMTFLAIMCISSFPKQLFKHG